MKAISVKADGTIEQVDVNPENWEDFSSYINDDFPNIVRRGPVETLGAGVVMVVADTGLLRDLPQNKVGGALYGGNHIVGDVLIIGEVVDPMEGADFSDLTDPDGVVAALQHIHARLP